MAAVENVNAVLRAKRPAWVITLANLLPLWFLSLAVMVEGFPRPPFPGVVGFACFIMAIVSYAVLVWKRWMTPEIFLYSILPFLLLGIFDEITTTYKTPFIFMCALILTGGVIAGHFARSTWLRLVILLAAGGLMLATAGHATGNFWQLHDSLHIGECFIDQVGCPPLPPQAPPWWQLFFG